MKIAFTTLGCPDWSLDQIVEAARQLAYDGVELRLIAGNMDLLSAPELTVNRAQSLGSIRAAKLEICCLDSSVRFDDPSASTRAEQLQAGRQTIDLAQALGVPFVRVFGDTFAKAESPAQVMDWVVDGVRGLAAHAERTGVTVLLESHGDFSRADLLGEVMQRVNAPQAGILWDVHHPWRFHGESPQQTVATIGGWIRHTHWKDSVRTQDDPRGYRYVLFGEGELPVREFIGALRTIQYDGWLALEWEKKWHPTIDEPEVAFPQFIGKMRAVLAG
jgi:sugar phosphate isomerase/epimerase